MRYSCPHHPEVVSDKPGKCPKCGGMELVPGGYKEDGGHGGHNHMAHHAMMAHDFKKRFWLTLPLVLVVLILSSKIQEWLGIKIDFPGREFVLFALGSIVALWGGWPFFTAAKEELRSRNYGMMTLVSLAVLTGFVFSTASTFLFLGESLWWEISTLVLAFLFGHWMEMRAVMGTTGALEELAKLIPPIAHRLARGPVAPSSHPMSSSRQAGLRALDGTPSGRATPRSEIEDVPTEELMKGDMVLVRPGEKVPVDGVVIEGESSVNEAMITGESRPVFKKKGNEVIGGTINNDGSLTVRVTKIGKESAISQIMELIKKAQSSKPSVQRLADKAANFLTLAAIIVGSATFVYWMSAGSQNAIFAATLAITVVVIACPHALGLAIPTVTTITTAVAARNGILIKEMKALEVARKINWVIFDKTGTLTRGEFGVEKIVTGNTAHVTREEILRLAAAVDYHSQHSIARAIVREAERKGIKIRPAKSFKSYPGRGATGKVGSNLVTVGNKMMMEEAGIKNYELGIKNLGSRTPVFVGLNKTLIGVILLEDQIREESYGAVEKLHKMGIKVAMLTGDKKDVAEDVGKRLGIDTVFAEVLPEDKVDKIRELQKGSLPAGRQVVGMVGDGVNDAPALTQAHVGIAIGAGTDVAVEAGQIILVKNDPQDVVKAISLSRKVDIKMKQNLGWAAGYNIFAIPVAAGILYPWGILLRPEWAALLMSASSIIVVFNALLLRRVRLD